MSSTLKKLELVLLLDNASPKKNSFEFSKKSLSRIVTEVPTVDRDCAFLLGAITMIGMSSAKIFVNDKFIKIIKIKNILKRHQLFLSN